MTQCDLDPIYIGNGIIESVTSFCYLGSVVECYGGVSAELPARVSCVVTCCGVWSFA